MRVSAKCYNKNRRYKLQLMHRRKQNHVVEIRSDRNEAKNNSIIYALQTI